MQFGPESAVTLGNNKSHKRTLHHHVPHLWLRLAHDSSVCLCDADPGCRQSTHPVSSAVADSFRFLFVLGCPCLRPAHPGSSQICLALNSCSLQQPFVQRYLLVSVCTSPWTCTALGSKQDANHIRIIQQCSLIHGTAGGPNPAPKNPWHDDSLVTANKPYGFAWFPTGAKRISSTCMVAFCAILVLNLEDPKAQLRQVG